MTPQNVDTRLRSRMTAISLTGADDRVKVESLQCMSEEFPFVEWALLYLPGKEGTPRNPSRAWRESFHEAFTSQGAAHAVHLCGSEAFREMLEDRLPADLTRFERVQLNINPRRIDFNDEQIIELFEVAITRWSRVILQYHEGSATAIPTWLNRMVAEGRSLQNVDVLIDFSRGRGIEPAKWAIPPEFTALHDTQTVGLAGAIGPDNIERALSQGSELQRPYWADMESGIRTENQFDVAKARQVLMAGARFLRLNKD